MICTDCHQKFDGYGLELNRQFDLHLCRPATKNEIAVVTMMKITSSLPNVHRIVTNLNHSRYLNLV